MGRIARDVLEILNTSKPVNMALTARDNVRCLSLTRLFLQQSLVLLSVVESISVFVMSSIPVLRTSVSINNASFIPTFNGIQSVIFQSLLLLILLSRCMSWL